MELPRVEVGVTYFAVYYGFSLIGVYSAYQLQGFSDNELALYWGYQVA